MKPKKWLAACGCAFADERVMYPCPDHGYLVAENIRLRETVGFFASVIRGGEPWTATCEAALRRAKTGQTDALHVGESVKAGDPEVRYVVGDLQHERSPTLLAIADRMKGAIALLREVKEALDDGRFTEGGDGEQWLDERLDALHAGDSVKEGVQ